MSEVSVFFQKLLTQLRTLASSNSVAAKPISVGDKHVVPLCELSVGLGGGGGRGEGGSLSHKEQGETDKPGGKGFGQGFGGGGGVTITPIATLVVNGDDVQIKILEK